MLLVEIFILYAMFSYQFVSANNISEQFNVILINSNKLNDSKIFFFNNLFSNFFTTTTQKNIAAQIISIETICNPCQCGTPNVISAKIVNGTTTRPNYYPWSVYLTYKGRFYTGAVVINNLYVLTAAHSGNIQNLPALRVIFLDHNREFSSRSELSFSRRVMKIITHRQYSRGSQYNNDIALVKLEGELTFPDDFLRPICLPKNDEKTYAGLTGTITGWGSTSEYGNFSQELQEAQVNIWTNADCVQNSEYTSEISENMICAGYIEGGIDACKGDSGGPLQILDENNLYTQIGIVSWGKGCAEPRKPGVYTRVSKYLNWIQENTKDACYCT